MIIFRCEIIGILVAAATLCGCEQSSVAEKNTTNVIADGSADDKPVDDAASIVKVSLSPQKTSDRVSGPKISLREAFFRAFGKRNSATRTTESGKIVFKPGRIVMAGSKLVLISPGTNIDDCHACSGSLAIHYFDTADNYPTGEWLSLSGGTSWGGPANEWSISTGLLDVPVLYSEGGGTWQGCSSSVVQLTALLPGGPVASELIPVSQSNASGFGEPTEFEGKVVDVTKGWGFTMRYTYTTNGRKRIVKDKYRWNGARFAVVGNISAETC